MKSLLDEAKARWDRMENVVIDAEEKKIEMVRVAQSTRNAEAGQGRSGIVEMKSIPFKSFSRLK
jgi:hypothetical protein